jgi:hypothetical protein
MGILSFTLAALLAAAGHFDIFIRGGHYLRQPATIRIETVLVPDPANRELAVVLEGPDYYSSSTFQLTEHAASFYVVTCPRLPPGLYQAGAVLRQVVDGKERIETRASNVVEVLD